MKCTVLLSVLALSAGLFAWAAPVHAPPPPVAPPGEVQPVAPGTRAEAPLPTLTLSPAIPEVSTVQVLSNGFVRAAHALVLLPGAELTPDRAQELAITAAERTYQTDPALAEVDVSVYRAETYGGFGGPLPLLTLSVSRERRAQFAAQVRAGQYDRVWQATPVQAAAAASAPAALQAREHQPVFVGSRSDLHRQQLTQSLGAVGGGTRGGLLFSGDPAQRRVALTFDDAPHPLFYPLVLDVLRREKVKATFFIIGRNAQAYPYFIRDMTRDGHELGNHTFHHVRLPSLSAAQITAELKATDDLLTSLTGQPVRYFRPPGGEYDSKVLQVARSLGLTTVFWTDDPGDFQNPGVQTVENRFARHLRPGGIILLHDNAVDGLLALPELLNTARHQGYALGPVGHFAAR